jgi:hypothetical protein
MWKTVVGEFCPLLADLEATQNFVSGGSGRQVQRGTPRASDLQSLAAKRGFPGLSRNSVDPKLPSLMLRIAMLVLRLYATRKGATFAMSA